MKKLFSLFLILTLVFSVAAAYADTKDIPEAKVPENHYLTLVNKGSKLPANWTSLFEFDVGKNALGELFIVEREALRAFGALRAKLLEEGIQIELDSIYRSLGEQQDIWDIWSADPEKGPEYCEKYLAPVGCSEHHTGLALDIFIIKPDGSVERGNDEMIADRETFARVHAHLAEFGFILRYIEGKEDITGYSYEPWHLRFINDPAAAAYIMENNLTLEEYLGE